MAAWISKTLRWNNSYSAVYIYIYQILLTPCISNSLQNTLFLVSTLIERICLQITLFILNQVTFVGNVYWIDSYSWVCLNALS